MHHAATRPAMAPEAPREVTVNCFVSTCALREVREPMTPDAMNRARKLPRPISSWTELDGGVNLALALETGKGVEVMNLRLVPMNHRITMFVARCFTC